MNGFYIAKRQLRWAGFCDLAFASLWSLLILICAIYHFGYLLPNKYRIGPEGTAHRSTTVDGLSGIVASRGYSGLFDVVLVDFIFFRLTLWVLVLTIWIFTVAALVGKVLLGTAALVRFFRGKSIQHIYAALSVIFLPALGGIIALNTYGATTGKLSPKYLAPHSFVRFRLRRLWRAMGRGDSLGEEHGDGIGTGR